MSAKDDAAAWAEVVQQVAAKKELRYDEIGGLNPVGGPVVHSVSGGSNRHRSLEHDSRLRDADEHEEGGLFLRSWAVLLSGPSSSRRTCPTSPR